MLEQVRKDVIAVLKDTNLAIREKRFGELHGLSDHLIHSMSVFQNKDIIDVAIAIYTLNKIFGKERHIKHKKMRLFVKTILQLLKNAINFLEKSQEKRYEKIMHRIIANIQGFDKKISVYVEDVLEFARVKKGSRIYEHGISLGQAAATAGVTKWELMPIAGETRTHEDFIEPITTKRIALVKKLFKVGL